eukprot:TRINITY_DN30226_c0_g1_i1.p1 TRINITY_DN30226_c0_g1~~TRINITY_DN30226_c0_g1_i1.p1  ORF type:complete len:796 (-),score=190.05 TRINITY_DN30226_c0_g1_i1:66-2453(-)
MPASELPRVQFAPSTDEVATLMDAPEMSFLTSSKLAGLSSTRSGRPSSMGATATTSIRSVSYDGGGASMANAFRMAGRGRAATFVDFDNLLSEAGDGREEWSPGRRWWADILENQWTDTAMGFIIFLNTVLIIWDVDTNARCYAGDDAACVTLWSTVFELFFVMIYSVECGIRLNTYRVSFFYNRWNNLDFTILALAYVDLIIAGVAEGGSAQSLKFLKSLRLFRLVRALRMLEAFPQLYQMVSGFASAMIAMWWGFVMIIILLFLWSVIVVEFVFPGAREAGDAIGSLCIDSYSGVFPAVLMLFQTLVAGDSWGVCAVPTIKAVPSTFFVFAGALVSVQLGFTNLILSVIVESAAAAREEDARRKIKARRQLEEMQTLHLYKTIQSIDKDNSGTLTLHEILRGYKKNEDLKRLFDDMEIGASEIRAFFQLMDVHGLGEIAYDTFVREIRKAQTQDLRLHLLVARLQSAKATAQLQARFDEMLQCVAKTTSEADKKAVSSRPRPKLQSSKPTAELSCRQSSVPLVEMMTHEHATRDNGEDGIDEDEGEYDDNKDFAAQTSSSQWPCTTLHAIMSEGSEALSMPTVTMTLVTPPEAIGSASAAEPEAEESAAERCEASSATEAAEQPASLRADAELLHRHSCSTDSSLSAPSLGSPRVRHKRFAKAREQIVEKIKQNAAAAAASRERSPSAHAPASREPSPSALSASAPPRRLSDPRGAAALPRHGDPRLDAAAGGGGNVLRPPRRGSVRTGQPSVRGSGWFSSPGSAASSPSHLDHTLGLLARTDGGLAGINERE